MAEKDKPLIKIAESSPGIATAVAQSNLPKNEFNQIQAMVQLRNIHNELTSLPQNDAYNKYKSMDKVTKDALASMFDPKYQREDKGFFGNILQSVKSAVWYGGGTTRDLADYVPIQAAFNAAGAGLKTLGTQVLESGPIEKGLEYLVRSQEKLIKQPYQSARLAQEEGALGAGGLLRYQFEGFKELLPGGEDALPTDNSASFKRYWEQASQPISVFDESSVLQYTKDLTPAAAYLGRKLASKENLIDNFEQFQDSPAVMDLVNRYVENDPEALKEVANATALFEKSKISPGRDIARAMISVLPHEYEKAVMGDGNAKALFTAISAPIDFGVTFVLDPLIIGGKVQRGLMVAKYGIFKIGEGTIPLEKAFNRPKVRAYWDEAGKLIDQYRNGNLAIKAAALNRLQDRFREININVVEDLANAGVANADDALEYFDNGRRFLDMMSGGLGVAGKFSLVPRMTKTREASNGVRDFVSNVLGTQRYSNMPVSKTKEDFVELLSQNPIIWTDKVGFEKTGIIYTPKDKSRAAKIDKVVRLFSIAPEQQRIINIADGTASANQIYKLARTVLDKNSSGLWRAAWLGADEGERLVMFRGLLKTLGVGMGLNLSAEGRTLLARLDDMSKELYSPNQSSLELGDLANALKTVRGGSILSAPKGVRQKVQEANTLLTAENKANRLIASVSAKVREYTTRAKALRIDLKEARKLEDKQREALIRAELKIVGAKLGAELKIKKELLGKFKKSEDDTLEIADITDELDEAILGRFNAGQMADGTPAAVRQYQLSDYRTLPKFDEWREAAQRAGVLTSLFGKAANNYYNKRITDIWSFLNLYPRLGLRSSVEEVGMFGLIGGAEGLGYYIKARQAGRELRIVKPTGTKVTVFGKEKADSNLGLIYTSLYKIMGKFHSKEEIVAMANDPVLLNKTVAASMIKNRFKPGFLQSESGKDYAKWTGDFAEFDGHIIMDDITGSVVRAENKVDELEEVSKSLKQFGPSVSLNVQNQEALKGLKFKGEIGEISSQGDKAIFSWFIELQNTIGGPNGKFGNIVLWNLGKTEDKVIAKIKEYIRPGGAGNDIAKRYAMYSDGIDVMATNIYADATYALRDYSGQINMKLVNAIRDKGGIDKFDIDDLIKFDKPFARPETLLGKEIIPLVGKSPTEIITRIIDSGYGWMGKQIALLDREPITLANYFMFRKQLKGTEAATKKSLIDSGLTEEGADSIARFSSHSTAMNLARNRTLSFVDNGEIRTNLALGLRTFGRYYRSQEDFFRRLGRLVKYEKRALVRLAILNQTFDNNGIIHEDDRGQKYFTYPFDDIFAWPIVQALSVAGVTTQIPMPIKFGGYLHMLTPSLDAESWTPGISNPVASLAIDAFTNIPYVGKYMESIHIGPMEINPEQIIRGNLFSKYPTDVAAWEKAAPANLKRVVNLFSANPENNAQRFSSATSAIKLLVSTGNGPTNSSEIDKFYQDIATQAKNIDMIKFVMGQGTIASIQSFNNESIPKELINAGVYTYDSEYRRILKKFDGDPQALPKALVQFAKLYPSKLAYTNFGTHSTTFADFRKTYEAEQFVRKNEKLLIDHADAGSFFIPAVGTEDINAYAYLKKKGYISNKKLNPKVEDAKGNFIREVATSGARMAYYALRDEYNAKISAEPNPNGKRYYRQQLEIRQKGLLTAYPLLKVQIQPTTASNARRDEVIADMKRLISDNRAPDKDLANTFSAMISEYEKMVSLKDSIKSSSTNADNYKKALRADTKDRIYQLSKDNENALTFFNTVIDPLIGD